MQRTFSQTGHRATCLSCWQQTGTPLMSQTDTCGTFSPVVLVPVLCVSEKGSRVVAGAESKPNHKPSLCKRKTSSESSLLAGGATDGGARPTTGSDQMV